MVFKRALAALFLIALAAAASYGLASFLKAPQASGRSASTARTSSPPSLLGAQNRFAACVTDNQGGLRDSQVIQLTKFGDAISTTAPWGNSFFARPRHPNPTVQEYLRGRAQDYVATVAFAPRWMAESEAEEKALGYPVDLKFPFLPLHGGIVQAVPSPLELYVITTVESDQLHANAVKDMQVGSIKLGQGEEAATQIALPAPLTSVTAFYLGHAGDVYEDIYSMDVAHGPLEIHAVIKAGKRAPLTTITSIFKDIVDAPDKGCGAHLIS